MSVLTNVGGGVGNVRYDSSTDTIQVKYNGSWVDWKKAYIQFDGTLYDSGTQAVSWDNNGYALTSTFTSLGGATFGINSFSFPNAPSNAYTNYVTFVDDVIDVTNWNFLYLIYDGTTYSLDVSALSGSYYIYVTVYKSSAGMYNFKFGLSTTKQYFNDNNVGVTVIVDASSTSSDITKAVTKVWLDV